MFKASILISFIIFILYFKNSVTIAMKKLFLLLFFLFPLLIFAQKNENFTSLMFEAWELHSQKLYDSAETKYVKALEGYVKPKITFNVSPEYKSIAKQLERIFKKDQSIRNKYLKKNYPIGSKNHIAIAKEMQEVDSLNLIEVRSIVDQHGWLGQDKVGYLGNKSLFFVIQHADVETQLDYLPQMIEALAQGYLEKYQMAYLIDRISLREKRLLMFGSEVRQDTESNAYYLTPTWGIETLDYRRELVDLKPMEAYLKGYNIEWNPETYSKNLPELIKKLEF